MFCAGNAVIDPRVRESVRAFIRELWLAEQENKNVTNDTIAVVEETLPALQPVADTSDTYKEEQGYHELIGETDPNSSNRRSRRNSLPKRTRIILKQWLHEHRHYAYPTEDDKALLSKATGLTVAQVSNWFTDARHRILPGIIRREGKNLNNFKTLQRVKVSPSASPESNGDLDAITGSPTPKVAVGDTSDIASSSNCGNQAQGSGEESNGQMDDDSLMCSWDQAILNNPMGFESLHPLLRTTIAAKVQAYRMRIATAFAAAVSATISSGANSCGSKRTNSPSGEKGRD